MTNLVEILKNAPKGLELYSVIHGNVKFESISNSANVIHYRRSDGATCWCDEYGRIYENGECVLFPSKENKNWDTWQKILFKPNYFITITGPKYNLTIKVQQYGWKDENKNTRFATIEEIENWYRKNNLFKSEDCIAESLVEFTIDDFKPFDKVLGFTKDGWEINLFSNYAENNTFPYICLTDCYEKCIPYNEETKHLLGTFAEYNGKYKTW